MKPWKITVSDKADPEVAKKIKRVLKPAHDVGRPQKCLFCEIETTWTINDKPLCPKCCVDYGFLDKGWLPGLCEVCGRQGEWWTEENQHFLCHIHRDAWFHWVLRQEKFESTAAHGPEWQQNWERNWGRFIAEMKEKEAAVPALH
jgi:hypothetical protein